MQFVNPKSDIAFKKIFGDEDKKHILISFLNAILELEDQKVIEELKVLNPYQAPKLIGLKYTTLDIRVKNKQGISFIIEMQVEPVAGYKKKFLYYTSKAYAGQIDKGDDYPKLNQVIFIGILNFDAFEGEEYLTKHLILNTKTCKQEFEDIEFNFIELTKFNKTEKELTGVLEKWIYFIKNAEDLDVIPDCADFAELREAYEVANRFAWKKEDLEVYEYWAIKDQDEIGAIEYATTKGREEGKKEGKEEGREGGILIGKIQLIQNILNIPVTTHEELNKKEIDELTRILEPLENKVCPKD